MGHIIRVLVVIALLSTAVQPRLAKAEQAVNMKGNVKMDQTAEFFQPQPLFYPELEAEIGGVTVFYAKNQKEAFVKTISVDLAETDEQYGPTWYPRWMWVKNVRWQDEPDRHLSWDDVVEDMSMAVGEDLFPFFREIGTTLQKERFPSATFMGKKIELSPVQIPVTKGGAACLGDIGDYKAGWQKSFILDNHTA